MKHIHTYETKSKAIRARSYLSRFFICTQILHDENLYSGQRSTPYFFHTTGTKR